MKVVLNKLNVVLHETVRVVRPSRKVVSTSTMEKNSTTSDTIGLAVLTMFLLALSQSMPIEYGNQRERNE